MASAVAAGLEKLTVADGPATTAPTADFPEIGRLDPVMEQWLVDIFNQVSHRDSTDLDVLESVWQHGQQDERTGTPVFPTDAATQQAKIQALRRYFLSDRADATAPAEQLDESYPIASYFISSSHNTYLSGNQLSSLSSAAEYEKALSRGCRCVEIDVWDGDSGSDSDGEAVPAPAGSGSRTGFRRFFRSKDKKDKDPKKPASPKTDRGRGSAEPVVYHGYTMTNKIPFRVVCDSLRAHAFVHSSLPLIVSLEVHTSHEQQQMMVEIMESAFKGYLVEQPDEHDRETPLPTLADLRNKVLIKVKYTAPTKTKTQAALARKVAESGARKTVKKAAAEPVDLSDSEDDEPARSGTAVSTLSSKADGQAAGRPSKIIEALGRMGFYTRSFHFHSFSQPEASIPTHIFSLSEGAVATMHKTDPLGLWNHNRNFMMRTYPRGTRFTSSNLDPILFWRRGVQVVALNWQKLDKGTMLNSGMFTGTSGWVLKPDYFRGICRTGSTETTALVGQACSDPTAAVQPLVTGSASPSTSVHSNHMLPHHALTSLDLKITVYCGQNLPIPENDTVKDFRPYLKVELHVESEPTEDGEGTKAKDGPFKQQVEWNKKTTVGRLSTSPNFDGKSVEWKSIDRVVPELTFVRFKLMDADRVSSDDLAGWACIRLDRLRQGYRFVRLWDCKGHPSTGVLLVKVEKQLK